MKANKAYKYRLYPNQAQRILFSKTFGSCRWVWNRMLSEKTEAYEEGRSIKLNPANYKIEYPWLKEIDSLSLCNEMLDLRQAYNNFFSKRANKPKFKSRKNYKQSYRTNNQRGSISIDYESSLLKLPKVGLVKVKLHRGLPVGAKIKNVTVSKTSSGKYYAAINFEYEVKTSKAKKANKRALGIDYSSAHFFVDSEGFVADMPHYYRVQQKRLRKAQRRLARMKKFSKNYSKQKKRIALIHEKIANQRHDFQHKQSRRIADEYDIVCVEDLNMKSVARSLKLAKATYDNGFGEFRCQLKYKLEERGKQFVKAEKSFPSSQLCHVCGEKNPEVKDLKVRDWICPHCGAIHDRDINAAINLKNYALA